MKIKICSCCSRVEKNRLKRSLCSSCYNKAVSKEVFSRVTNLPLDSPWKYNDQMWLIYIKGFKNKKINGMDTIVIRKFKTFLLSTKLVALETWTDIFQASDTYRLGTYKRKDYTFCPILKIGTVLQEDGILKDRKIHKHFYDYLKIFSGKDQEILKKYRSELKTEFKYSTYSKYLYTLKEIKEASGKNLADLNESDFRLFIIKLSEHHKTLRFYWKVRHLRRFCNWMKANDFFQTDVDKIILKTATLWKPCSQCKKLAQIPKHSRICYSCSRVEGYFQAILNFQDEVNKEAKWKYNRYLFELYILYIKRYGFNGHLWQEAKEFANFLKNQKLSAFSNWYEVCKVSDQFYRFVEHKSPRGCPVKKVGYMLSELGIIPIRSQDEEAVFERLAEKLGDVEQHYRAFAKRQLKRQRRITTVIQTGHIIKYFQKWIKEEGVKKDFFNVTKKNAEAYLLTMKPSSATYHRGPLNVFYRWCVDMQIAKSNPFEKIKPHEPPDELLICSKSDFKKILTFIKNPKSDPAQALILALILFYGLSMQELQYSKLKTVGYPLDIDVFKRPLSYGHRYEKRTLNLLLPNEPKWFLNLQKRFLEDWEVIYSNLNNQIDNKPLFLTPRGVHNRPTSYKGLRSIIVNATTTATGRPVPFKVLKPTAGHIHTLQGDASLLTNIGWARTQAFKYTWVPRKYF